MSLEPIRITDIADIDLDCHAVIEASAGTGKTYCIENLVVRLLCEKEIPLEQILLVTFTEKATGELHERIRANILAALAAGRGKPALLQQALENFDTACIHTIHGFCQRMLQQYAFENSGSSLLEVVDDAPLYESLLHNQQRRDWPQVYGAELGRMIALSNYPNAQGGRSRWEQTVLDLARRFRPEGGDRLLPEPAPTPKLERLDRKLAKGLDKVIARLGEPADPLPKSKLYWWYKKLFLADSTKKDRSFKIIMPLLDFFARHRQQARRMMDFIDLAARCAKCTGFSEQGFSVLLDGLQLDGDDALDDYYDNLKDAVAQLDDMTRRLNVKALANQLAVNTIRRLQDEVREHKEEHGLISFDDMLRLLAQALDPAHNDRAEQLVAQLRRRFRYALVDEFQDTDPVQWQIFRRIFLESPEQRLLVIGDPKQAIYGFRGADLQTYLSATETMLARHGARLYSLPVNWRSTPSLINALNQLCGARDWFHSEGRIRFEPVVPPPDNERQARIFEDQSERAALTVVDLNKDSRNLTIARRWMASFIADEISRLLGDRSLVINANGRARQLVASDICILVRKTGETDYLEEFLTRNEIPYSFYKQGGLYQSDEARQLYYLFQAIAAPGNAAAVKKALLTQFFNVPAPALEHYAELPPQYPAKKLLQTWNEYAEARRWAPLVQSILEDTGILFRENVVSGGDRRLTNYRHILHDLEQAAQLQNLDFSELLDVLRNYRQEVAELPDELNLHQIDSDRAKVQIMTIHTSKGLEFPILFLAGGFTHGPENEFWCYHDDEGRRVYDLGKSPEAAPDYQREMAEEDRRLYYVALTRTIYKLYVPRFRPRTDRGWSGPVPSFIYDSLETAFEGDDNADVRHINEHGHDLTQGRPWLPVIDQELPAAEAAVRLPPPSLPEPLLPPGDFSFARRLRLVGSFSAFAHQSSRHKSTLTLLDKLNSFADEASLRDDESLELDDLTPQAGEDREPDLPHGNLTGSLLHEILEKISFAEVAAATGPEDLLESGCPAATLIDELLTRYQLTPPTPPTDSLGRFATAWRGAVARLVFNALTTPLEGGLRLAELPASDRIHELEFFYPALAGPRISELSVREGFLTGFIDLIFRFAGRYYILDWKSNYLEGGYAPEQLATSMDEAGYRLQYKVYTIAVLNWLQQREPDFDFDRQFGGIYYLYMRGMSGADMVSGVFFHRPKDTGEIAAYRQELAALFRVEERVAR